MSVTGFPTGIKLGGSAPAGETSDGKIYIYNSSDNLVATIDLTPGDALTKAVTTITHDEPSTADYDYSGSSITNTSPYGLSSANEFKSLLKVIKNLQTRVNELEARLQDFGLLKPLP